MCALLGACQTAQSPCENLTAPSAGEAGWNDFTCLAQTDATDLGPAQSVKVMVFNARTDAAVPEKFPFHWQPIVNRLQFSSLSPHATVVAEPFAEQLVNALVMMQAHFGTLYGRDPWTDMALDTEWKIHPDANGKPYLLFKPVRPY